MRWIREWFKVPAQAWDWKVEDVGEIDKLYRAERDMNQMLRKENERIREASGGWAKEVDRLDAELRLYKDKYHQQLDLVGFEAALADDLYDGLDTLLRTGDPRKADAAKARYREARQQ